jgi:hypothetical protein
LNLIPGILIKSGNTKTVACTPAGVRSFTSR